MRQNVIEVLEPEDWPADIIKPHKSWRRVAGRPEWYVHKHGLRALRSVMREADGRLWLHVSISLPDKLPSYAMLVKAKNELVGRMRKAIQVFPSEEEHVNVHPYCLHLWSCLEDDPLPDFSRGIGQI